MYKTQIEIGSNNLIEFLNNNKIKKDNVVAINFLKYSGDMKNGIWWYEVIYWDDELC